MVRIKSAVLYLWKGYLSDERYSYSAFLGDYKWEYLHTSGHADKDTLAEIVKIVAPTIGVIPIHSDYPEGFSAMDLTSKVIFLEDRKVFSI